MSNCLSARKVTEVDFIIGGFFFFSNFLSFCLFVLFSLQLKSADFAPSSRLLSQVFFCSWFCDLKEMRVINISHDIIYK